ncbi:MAG: restriction endonuclease subunit S [Thermodesulfobacteriota bacterium]|nr:restriction endonuclease subunit S [Thermodesulfobacteriota bacterium]
MRTSESRAWPRSKLGDFFRLKHGYAFKGKYFSSEGKYILLTPGNFAPEGGIKLKGEKEKHYVGQFPDEFLLKRDELLVVMTDLKQDAPILGSAAFVPVDNRFLHNQRLGKVVDLRTWEIHERYLYYLFNSSGVRGQIKASATGATVRHTAPDRIYSVDVSLPDIETQRKIASILSAYDDLIENNLRRIKILEEMAQTIYREWFVKFRFPGHEKTRMVDSPLGKIPEGWEVIKVGGLLEKVRKKKKLKKQYYETDGPIPVVDQGRDFIGGYTTDPETLFDSPLPIIVFGDHTRVLKYIDFPFACGADGTQLLRPNTEQMPISLFYYVLKSIDLSDFAYARHFKFLKEQEVLVPNEQIARLFAQVADPMRDLIRCLLSRNDTLRRTRDLLLPKLISGELDVSDLDIDVAEEAA